MCLSVAGDERQPERVIDRYSDATPDEDAENTIGVASRGYRYRPAARGVFKGV
jgi:hypothetical protein